MSKYRLSPTGKLLALVVAAFIALGVFVLIQSVQARPVYDCTQLKKMGYAHILQGDRNYNAAMDRDHDGIACE